MYHLVVLIKDLEKKYFGINKIEDKEIIKKLLILYVKLLQFSDLYFLYERF